MPIIDIGVNTSALKRGAQQAKSELAGVGTAADKAKGTLARMGSEGKSAGEAIGRSMASAASSVVALVGAYKTLEGMKNFVRRGVQFNSTLEQSQIGIASIITSMVDLEDAQGRTLEGAEKYQAAQGLAADMMKEIQRLGLETTANTTDLVAGVQSILAPAKQAGMALKDIPKFAVAGAQAMQTLGVPLNQMRTELSALLTGRVNKTQDILAPKLFSDVQGDLGEYIRKLKETGELIPEITRRLEPFALAGKDVAQTWSGLVSNLDEAFDVIAGQAGEGLTKSLKESVMALQNFFTGADKAGNVTIGKDFENIAFVLHDIQSIIGDKILAVTKDFIGLLQELNKPETLAQLKANFESFGKTASDIWEHLKLAGGILGDILSTALTGWNALPDVVREMGVIGAVAFGIKGKAVLASIVAASAAIDKATDWFQEKFGDEDMIAAHYGTGTAQTEQTTEALKKQTEALKQNAEARRDVVETVNQTTQAEKDAEAAIQAHTAAQGTQLESTEKAVEWLQKRYDATEDGKKAAEDHAIATDAEAIAMLRAKAAALRLQAAEIDFGDNLENITDAQLAKINELLASAEQLDNVANRYAASAPKFGASGGGRSGGGGGSSQVDSAKESIARLREEIAQLGGTMNAGESALQKKIADIEKLGKQAGMSRTEIAQLKEEYAQAFQTDTLRKFEREMLQLEGNAAALAQLDMAEKVQQWQQQLEGAGLSAEEAATKVERMKAALEKQQNYKDLQTVVGFYKELGNLSGQLNASTELQNQLIHEQAEAYIQSGIPEHLARIWEQLQKIENAKDPFSGFIRGARKFGNDYGDLAKQVENVTTQMGSHIANTLSNAFMTGKFSAQDFFNSLISMATQAASNYIIGQLFSGIGSMFGGFGGGGGVSAKGIAAYSAAKSSFFGFAQGGVFANGIGGYSNSVVSTPTLFNYGAAGHVTAFAKGAGLMGEAGPEAIMPLTRTASGDLGVRAIGGAGVNFSPAISVNVVNQTGQGVNAETNMTQNGDGGFSLDILLTQVEQGLVARAKQGRSSLMRYQESTYGIGRANVIQQAKGRA